MSVSGIVGSHQVVYFANKSIEEYLTEKPEVLAKQLSEDCDNFPYIDILKVCNAEIAMPLLACLTSDEMLDEDSCHHAINALQKFNTADRLPVLVDALKLGRTEGGNCINISNLLNGDNTSIIFERYGELLNLVRAALQKELQKS